MAKEGQLSKDKCGYDMPVDAPLYARPPIYYKGTEAINFTYETDEAAVAEMLPAGLGVPSPPTATLMFIRYPFSTLGPYEEAILALGCTWQGEPRTYIAHIVVNTDPPMAAGREIWGFPKKFAEITLQMEDDLIWGTMDRPTGNRICSGVIRPEVPLPDTQAVQVPPLSLRVIPSPEEGAPPSLMELIETTSTSTTLEAWSGPGFAQYHSTSTIDPWHRIAVKKMLGASYRRYDQILGFGKIIKRY